MNGKISLPELSALLALASGRPRTACDNFLRSFISVVSDSLSQGESVKLKGFGTFGLTEIEARRSVDVATGRDIEIAAHRRITFTPSKELAAAVNAPFEMFEAVELADGFDVGEPIPVGAHHGAPESESEGDEPADVAGGLHEAHDNPEPTPSSNPLNQPYTALSGLNPEPAPEKPAPGQREIEEATDIFSVEPEPIGAHHGTPEPTPENPTPENPAHEPAPEEPAPEEPEPSSNPLNQPSPALTGFNPEPAPAATHTQSHPHRFLKGFLWGIATGILTCVLAIIITYAIVNYQITHIQEYDREPVTVAVTPAPAPVGALHEAPENPAPAPAAKSDTASQAEAANADAKVNTPPSDTKATDKWDTIGTRRYLTTMAKEHYGNYHLWPYIYEENRRILGHPDRIKPGTRVRIPDLKKYGIDPRNPEDIKRAKLLGVQIYSRYQ